MTATADPLASMLRRLRWPVAAVWVLAVVLLTPFASGLPKVTNDTASAYLPPAAQSTRIAVRQSAAAHASGQPVSQQAIVVFAWPGGLTASDLAAADAARQAVRRLGASITGLGVPGPLQRSGDGDAALFTVSVPSPQASLTSRVTHAVTAIRRAVPPPVKAAGGGLQAAVTGAAAVTADSGSTTLTALLLSALAIVALILLLVYRSPILWLLPLISAVGAVQAARAAAHGLAATGLTVSFLSSAVLIVLVFGAASDYAFLLIHRYREELQRHIACEDAMAAAAARGPGRRAAGRRRADLAGLCRHRAARPGMGPGHGHHAGRGRGPAGGVRRLGGPLAALDAQRPAVRHPPLHVGGRGLRPGRPCTLRAASDGAERS